MGNLLPPQPGDFRTVFDRSLAPLEIIDMYRASSDPQEKLGCVGILEGYPRPRALVDAGDLCLDLAASGLFTSGESMKLLTRAEHSWQAAVARQKEKAPYVDAYSSQALINLACLKHYDWLFMTDCLAPYSVAEEVYGQIVEIAQLQAAALSQWQEYQGNWPRQIKDLAGKLAETSTLLLLQRFGLRTAADSTEATDWIALPALFSQDAGGSISPNEEPSSAWDISILTQYHPEIPPNLTYKVQVKTAHNKKSTRKSYKEDIDVIYVANDLRLPGEEWALPLDQVSNECHRELTDLTDEGKQVSDTLDERTEKLLGILD